MISGAVLGKSAAANAGKENFSELAVQGREDFCASYVSGPKNISSEIVDLVQNAADWTEKFLAERTDATSGKLASDLLPVRDMQLVVSIARPTDKFASIVMRFHRNDEGPPAVVVCVERGTGPWEIRGVLTDRNIATDINLKIRV